MNRRRFFYTSAGLTAIAVAPGVWRCSAPVPEKNQYAFQRYRPAQTLVPVTCVTPDDGFYLHTFYDICPWSPSGRLLAVTRMPFQDRQPVPGDTADVCVIDLQERSIRTVYRTKGWGFQLGANLNWGTTDRYLYTNDLIDGQGVCVRIDLKGGEPIAYCGPMYHLAPDESCVIGFPLDLINATQAGYGVPVDWDHIPQLGPADFAGRGLWKTDLADNRKTLLVSIMDLYRAIPDRENFSGEVFYMFHSKFNKQNSRIMQVFRARPVGGRMNKPMLFTFRTDGSDKHVAVTARQWAHGGHHPNWHPDGEHLIINLKPDGKSMRFCRVRYDGTDFRVLARNCPGSGHPSISPDSRYIVTDAYPGEAVAGACPNDEVPIRLVDLKADREERICSIYTLGKGKGVLRLDPHPAWNRDYNQVCFNGAPEGKRRVYIADLTEVVSGGGS